MRVVYVHHEPLTFTDYLNLETGQTLTAVPGVTYDIAPASGRVVPELPEPWFTAAEPEAHTVVSATAAMTGETDFTAGVEPETPEG